MAEIVKTVLKQKNQLESCFKNAQKNIRKSVNFLFCFILYKEKMLTDKATIKS